MKNINYDQIFKSICESDKKSIRKLALGSNDPYLRFAAQIYITTYMLEYAPFIAVPTYKEEIPYIVKKSFYFPEWKIISLSKPKYALYFFKEKLIYKLIIVPEEGFESVVLRFIKFIEKARVFKNGN
jgi:hypothetical protein